jgi:hypothetical protein
MLEQALLTAAAVRDLVIYTDPKEIAAALEDVKVTRAAYTEVEAKSGQRIGTVIGTECRH